ncbi:PASTA domain-containing protein [Streptomyces sp. NBC_00075]|uniref:PASTA domain-containing protein n=1 Tax=Streptomyces sp. NBC_00093 TaxID=2975649 RepID=A0AAU2A1R4_9ACTN
MTSSDPRVSGCVGSTGGTPFEEELVNAMNDFANSADAPAFDAAGIVRKSRRKRTTTAIAGFAAALLLAGGGTALATAGSGGSGGQQPADPVDANIVLEGGTGRTDFKGLSLESAKEQLAELGLKPGTVKETSCHNLGKPDTVIGVSPHSPTAVPIGATVNLLLCSD